MSFGAEHAVCMLTEVTNGPAETLCHSEKVEELFTDTQKTCCLTLTKMTDHVVENCSKT